MSLTSLFKTKSSIFRAAIAADDLPAMEALLDKKGGLIYTELMQPETYAPMSPQMAALLARNAEKIVTNWIGQDKSQIGRVLGEFVVVNALKSGKAHVAAPFIEAASDFNRSRAMPEHPAMLLLGMDIPEAEKLPLLRRVAAGGLDKVEAREEFLFAAADKGFLAALDVFAAAGLDLRGNGEQLLRRAASTGNDEVCRHLVTRYGADAGAAAAAERTLGNLDAVLRLERLKDSTATAAPPTVESLSAEVKELRAAVLELTAQLGERSIDKPAMKAPAKTAGMG